MIKEITSISNSYIKELTKLKERKYIKNSEFFLVEGKHLIEEAHKNNMLLQVLTTEESLYDDIETIKVTTDIIKKLSDTMNPQPYIGVVKKFDNQIDLKNVKSILILDNVNDPGNMGTIIRTAVGLGVDLLVIGNDSVDIYNSKVIRATQGAIFNLKFGIFDIEKYIPVLKCEGFKIYGTALKNSTDLKSISKSDKYAIILGNEAQGIKRRILDLCDENIKIEITENIESLNVAIAGAIVMYYFKD